MCSIIWSETLQVVVRLTDYKVCGIVCKIIQNLKSEVV